MGNWLEILGPSDPKVSLNFAFLKPLLTTLNELNQSFFNNWALSQFVKSVCGIGILGNGATIRLFGPKSGRPEVIPFFRNCISSLQLSFDLFLRREVAIDVDVAVVVIVTVVAVAVVVDVVVVVIVEAI